MENLECKIESLDSKIESLDSKIESLDSKINSILSILEKDISKNTQKMGEHIDFVENIYETVKYPLGFVCNLIKRRYSSLDSYRRLSLM